MKRHGWWVGTLMALGLMILVSTGRKGPADASSLSRSSAGWSAARFYVEGMGSPVRTLDTPIAEGLGDTEVLVITGAAASDFSTSDSDAVERFLRKGGRLVFGYGRRERSPRMRQRLGFGFKPSVVRARSLNPVVWREEASRTLHLPLNGDGPMVAINPVNEYPVAGPDDAVLVRNPQNESLALLRSYGDGEVLLLPDEMLSNGRLNEPGNSALLEGIRSRFGDEAAWTFDEYDHGVASATSPSGLQSRRGLDLFIFQILLAYGLFIAALGRRFGPEWPEPAPTSGATGTFLMTIAGIHDRLGHHRDAARALGTRAFEILGVQIEGPDETESNGVRALMDVARRIHEKQKEGRIE